MALFADMRITCSKPVRFYTKSAATFLRGTEDKAAVEELCLSALGEAIPAAVQVAGAMEKATLASIDRVETAYLDMDNGPRQIPCAQVSILLKSTAVKTQAQKPAILFDFDGTVGDTEVPAMEVAFWEIAPYLPDLAPDADLDKECKVYVRENAGKAFEHMIEACDKVRESKGLEGTEATRKKRAEPPRLLEAIDAKRISLGLPAISALRSEGKELPTLLAQQKEDTVTRLAVAARPVPGVVEALRALQRRRIAFVIATTSGKPRVPVCVDAAKLRGFFPTDEKHIHSGESDFDPPKFKPAPDVYLRAASSVGRPPRECIAVEDSASGVGSASNAGIGLIVGYVGAGHISEDMKEAHAKMLMAGGRAENKRGADLVISHMSDFSKVVDHFASLLKEGKAGDGTKALPISAGDLPGITHKLYTKDGAA